MTIQRMIDLLKIEMQCVNRKAKTNCYGCEACDLVQDDAELQTMYASVIGVLEAQMPRVMTLEELVMWQKQPVIERDPIYVEYRKGKGFGAPHWAMDNFGFNVATCQDNYKSGVYGMLVRCWTSRPTDEQRKAVAWIEA